MPGPTVDADVLVVGAGIVGLATARALLLASPGLAVAVLDKEDQLAAHQSGRNSGVLHAGLYYRPDSDKARMVAAGRAAMERFATEHGVGYERCGKVVVATAPSELPALAELRARGAAQGVATTWLDRRALAEHEPHADGVAALHVPSTGVIDFPTVCRALADEVLDRGGTVTLGRSVTAAHDEGAVVQVETDGGPLRARVKVTCAGLHADRVAAMAGAALPGVRIAPFRGEYHELRPERAGLVRTLIYPVPDPRFPFLGVHLTRGIHGDVHAGPNAVPALAREGYSWRERDPDEVRTWLLDPASRRLARRYWRTGLGEIHRSFRRSAFVRALSRLVPDIRPDDLVPTAAGVRAQALRADGTLLDDFAFGDGPRVVSVLNAPSPAATASLEIGRVVAERALDKIRA
jgi:L-2-hydroxyglutarate oxidase